MVDAQTCPAIGTVLNSDMQGSFGWATTGIGPQSSVTYLTDAGTRYVHLYNDSSSQCTSGTLMNWISVPLEATMAHPTLKFTYRSTGWAPNLYFGDTYWSGTSGAPWQAVTVCVAASSQGIATQFQFSHGGCGFGNSMSFDLKNFEFVDDAVACP